MLNCKKVFLLLFLAATLFCFAACTNASGGLDEALFSQTQRLLLPETTADAAEMRVSLSAEKLNFDSSFIGCRSNEKEITVLNEGDETVTIGALDIDDDGVFRISATIPKITVKNKRVFLAPGASMSIFIKFAPNEPVEYKSELTFSVEQLQNKENFSVSLKGTGAELPKIIEKFQDEWVIKQDYLFVIDNSTTMQNEQYSLAYNFGKFLDWLTNIDVDYHIGVTTTQVDSYEGINPKTGIIPGHLYAAPGNPKFVTRDNCDSPKDTAFANMFVGTCCSEAREGGLEAIKLALSEPLVSDPDANAGFLRDDAQLVVIVISDEDDQSEGELPKYVDFLRNIHGARNYEMLSFCIIAGLDRNPPKPGYCSSQWGSAAPAFNYYEVYDVINNGLAMSICEKNWGEKFQPLGIDTFFARVQYRLAEVPSHICAIEVWVNGHELPEDKDGSGYGWVYDEGSNAIVFGESSVPPRGAEIIFKYQINCEAAGAL